LRHAAIALPGDHRNFLPPEARWQFIGIRLAQDS